MNELWGKLTNFSYELLGIFIPGLIMLLLLAVLWITSDASIVFGLPQIHVRDLDVVVASWFEIALVITASYFSGHLLAWISRKTGSASKGAFKRVVKSLVFRIPKPDALFNDNLQPLFIEAAKKLGISTEGNIWRRFYPIAKIVLAERLSRSLVSTYQNKYTLHRSLTAIGAILFWLSSIATFGALLHMHFNVFALLSVIAFSLLIVWGFSASFAYYYEMWGNVIVTETFAVVSGATDKKAD